MAAPEVLEAPAHWRTLDFISDLHLQTSQPATFAAWQDFMQRSPADAIFILGDLFEAWVGDDNRSDYNLSIIDAFRDNVVRIKFPLVFNYERPIALERRDAEVSAR